MTPKEAVISSPVATKSAARGSLQRNFSWAFAGNLVYGVGQWGGTVVLARLAGVTAIGTWALGAAIAAPYFMLTNLQLRAIQATDVLESHPFRDYMIVRALANVVAMLLVSGTILLSGYNRQQSWILITVALLRVIDAISDICYGRWQQKEQMRSVSISLMVRSCMGCAAIAVTLWMGGSLLLAAAANVFTSLMVLCFYDSRARSFGCSAERPIAPNSLFEICKNGLPLGGVMMLLTLNGSIPRYYLERMGGAAELGLLAGITSFLAAGSTVTAALGQSATPRLAMLFITGNHRGFNRLLLGMTALGAALGIATTVLSQLFGRQFLNLLLGPEFGRHWNILVMLSLSSIAVYISSFMGFALTAIHEYWRQVPLFIGLSLLTLLLSMWLIPSNGLRGAAYVTLGTNVAQMFGSVWLLRWCTYAHATQAATVLSEGSIS